ncbi:PEPxxWA-CTERM sorting domain-containing protein [Sandaracinobacter sp. RS1-74]|uniref:PEPxxWA-CTERM sorting domain-containing protein n=1 Tax=Sandaracinobacteroides sayramensis TaxID=2913411 RepID=UPI001EDABB3A|nr:PEPxxWA-CTERM sorting domain-containing protein [Sandaracinobacteroides sayramensis]MCG2840578.1 PEPxxWA-CTERM sorting domain-containing protein [Sandaracinobacteroides sayramensis]
MKEICALLLAGGVGAGSVVTVQQVKPAVSKPKKKPIAPKAHKTASRNVTQTQITDCPAVAAPLGGGIADLAPLPSFETFVPGSALPSSPVAFVPDGGVVFPGGGGGGSGGGGGGPVFPPSPAPGVPQPASWAMMLTGFGLVGLAMRKGSGPAENLPKST